MIDIRQMSAAELAEQLRRGKRFQIVDVREQEEWNEGHIPAAVHIPLWQLPLRSGELKRNSDPIVLVCRSGGRSMQACEYMQSQGVTVTNMTGGMLQWPDPVKQEK